MTFPTIGILIPTYNRPAICAATVLQLHRNLRYAGDFRYVIGYDDPDPEPLLQALDALRYDHPALHGTMYPLRSGQAGLGANLNRLLAWSFELVLQLDDDHHLRKPLDITPHARTLLDHPTAGAIRLMGVGGHRYRASLADYSGGAYWRIDWDSPELYIASNRPHLKHARFHAAFGLYPEGVRLGETEEMFCHTCKDVASKGAAPEVLIPLNQDDAAWDHVGESWQLRGL